MANKKGNTNDVLQVRRLFKPLSLDCCTLCMSSEESIHHLFLHHPVTLDSWHKLLRQTNLVWLLLEVFVTCWSFLLGGCWGARIGSKFYGKSRLTLIWIVRWKTNARIFENKWRTSKMLWDLVYFYSSFWHLLLQLSRAFLSTLLDFDM